MELVSIKKSQTCGSLMIVGGCCIGAGMIGLPVVSFVSGFFPTLLVMVLCYLFSTLSGLLILESTLWFDQEVNLFSIVNHVLGKWCKVLTGILFISLFYCLSVAYIDGAGEIISNSLTALTSITVSREFSICIFVTSISVIVYAGTSSVDLLNRLLMFLLGVVFLTLVSFGASKVDLINLQSMNFKASIATIPILLVCFGFQNMVPTLVNYQRRDVSAIRFAIITGNMIPFAIYTIWNFIILGMISHEQTGTISETLGKNDFVVGLLEAAHSHGYIITYVKAFSMLAIVTSFLPNCISFVDFIKDGIKLKSVSKKVESLFFIGLVIIPPTLFSLSYPHLFLKMLGFAGGVVNVLLFGFMPVIIIYVGRYVQRIAGPYQLMGGKCLLGAMFVLSGIFLSLSVLL